MASDSKPYTVIKRAFVNCWCLTGVFVICSIFALDASGAAPCVPAEQAKIDGYVPGQKKPAVMEKREPLETTKRQGEDDGGAYTATLLKYESYQIVLVRGTIDSVRTDLPAVIWAAGIKVGDVRRNIDSRIGYAKVFDSNDEAQYLVCSDIGDVYAILRFSYDRLATIIIVIDRP